MTDCRLHVLGSGSIPFRIKPDHWMVLVLVLVLVLDTVSNHASQSFIFEDEDEDDLTKIEFQDTKSVICPLSSDI